MHVASVVAANGAGHFRRSVGVLHRLLIAHPSLSLTMYCTDQQQSALRNWWRLRQLAELRTRFVTDFECGFRWPIVASEIDLLAWRDQLADAIDFQAADLVVSDNLGSVLALRRDAVLMGSFLWSEVLANGENSNTRRFVADEVAYLRTCRPPMLCVGGIATSGVLKETEAVQLSWMCEQPAAEPRTLSGLPRIGICGGTTTAAVNEVVQLARLLTERYDVVVDSAASEVPVGLLPGVRRGLLRSVPLSEVDIVLCRPGAGTVMDCVNANIPFLTFCEPESPEMEHTAERLADAGIADSLGRPLMNDRVMAAIDVLATPTKYEIASDKLHALPKNGLGEAAEWLSKQL